MDIGITEFFESLIKQYREFEPSLEAFKRTLEEDITLQDEYTEWCDAMGYSEKKGFEEFYNDYIEHSNSIWDSIYPNKEEFDGYDFSQE